MVEQKFHAGVRTVEAALLGTSCVGVFCLSVCGATPNPSLVLKKALDLFGYRVSSDCRMIICIFSNSKQQKRRTLEVVVSCTYTQKEQQ